MVDRDSKGRFVEGNTAAQGHKGAGGRPRRSTEETFLRALSERVTLEDWIKIIDVAMANAKAGDKDSRRWLSSYLIGLPTQYVNADIQQQGVITIRVVYEQDGET